MQTLFKELSTTIGYGILILLVISIIYFTIKTIYSKFKNKITFRQAIIETTYIKIIDFVKWIIIDTLRGKDRLRLYGIWAFTGYYGQGKTMGCVLYAKHLQEKYPHRNIKIYSNIDVEGQEGKITHWKQMLELPPNSIMIYDESQSDWSSTIGVSAFPEDFLRRITQVRKRSLAFFMTSPVFHRMNINLRESVNFIIESKNILDMDRWFKYTFYRTEDYERMVENEGRKSKYALWSSSFIASDNTYTLYDTSAEVESIKDIGETKVTKKDTANLKGVLDNFRNEIHKEMDDKIRRNLALIKK